MWYLAVRRHKLFKLYLASVSPFSLPPVWDWCWSLIISLPLFAESGSTGAALYWSVCASHWATSPDASRWPCRAVCRSLPGISAAWLERTDLYLLADMKTAIVAHLRHLLTFHPSSHESGYMTHSVLSVSDSSTFSLSSHFCSTLHYTNLPVSRSLNSIHMLIFSCYQPSLSPCCLHQFPNSLTLTHTLTHARTHTHTHSHTHTHMLTHSLIHSLSLSRPSQSITYIFLLFLHFNLCPHSSIFLLSVDVILHRYRYYIFCYN